MFEDVLVATDRHDTAEVTVRHGAARERRFVARFLDVVRELALPSGGAARARPTEVRLQSDHASRHAIDLAARHGARLHVLFTVDSVRYDTTVEFATEPLREEGEAAVGRLADAAERAGVATTTAVEVGRPARLVLDYAAAHDVDLIVLNARDTGSRWSRLRGGLVPAVIAGASAPVYVVPNVQPGHPD